MPGTGNKSLPKVQKCSEELDGKKRSVEREQDKHRGGAREVVEHESPEVHSESDPRF